MGFKVGYKDWQFGDKYKWFKEGMVTNNGSHYGIILETRSRGSKEILYLEDKEEDLTSLESIRRINEVNNYKGSDQFVSAYSMAG